MSSSPDLSPRARVLLAAGLVRTAWGLPRAPGDAAALGGTTVSLAAGLCGLVALALGRQPLGLVVGTSARGAAGPGGRARACGGRLVRRGVPGWAAARRRDRRACHRGARVPARTARAARVGAPGLSRVMALAFGLWHVAQPGYDGAPVESFLGTALGGFVTGCLYALSGSLTVAAFYHGLHNAPLKALGGVPVTAGSAGLAAGIALACTALLSVGLGWMVRRRGERESGRLS